MTIVRTNGRAQENEKDVTATLSTGVPRVNQRVIQGVRQKFTSQILPPYLRRSPTSARCYRYSIYIACPPGTGAKPCRCCSGDDAAGQSPAAITPLMAIWRTE